jgi:hypothetical protein
MMMNWKGFVRNRLWPNFKGLSRYSSGRTDENHENLNQDSQSPGRDFNPAPAEYEAGVLTSGPRRSVDPQHRIAEAQFFIPRVTSVTFRKAHDNGQAGPKNALIIFVIVYRLITIKSVLTFTILTYLNITH